MTAVSAGRATLAIAGIAFISCGALALWENPRAVLIDVGTWAATALIVHDWVFAPTCVALGLASRRLLPRGWWAAIGVAALCTLVLLVLAIQVYDRAGARPDSTTVLNHDYHRGLRTWLVIIWLAVPAYLAAGRLSPLRRATNPNNVGAAGDLAEAEAPQPRTRQREVDEK